MAQLVTILLGAVTLTLAFLAWRFFTEARALRTRYSGIADMEAELMEMKKKVEQTKREQQEFDSENRTRRLKLNQRIRTGPHHVQRAQKRSLVA